MTTDLDAVRAALSAATPGTLDPDVVTADAHLIAHAPEWLAALVEEVERLRDEVDGLQKGYAAQVSHGVHWRSQYEALRAKLARVEALADEWDSAVPDRGPEPHWFRSRNDLEAAADDLCEALGRS